MTTARAVIFAAVLIALALLVSAWIGRPQYSMTNAGKGVTIRLDQRSGDMVGCRELYCRAIVKDDDIVIDPREAAGTLIWNTPGPWDNDSAVEIVPAPPAELPSGYVSDLPAGNAR